MLLEKKSLHKLI